MGQSRILHRTGHSLLYRRQGIYRFRRFVPKALREIIGQREIKVSLRTTDLGTAKRRLALEVIKSDRRFEEARRILANPDARAFRAVQQDVEHRRKWPRTDDELDAESLALTDALEAATDGTPTDERRVGFDGKNRKMFLPPMRPDPVRAKILRAVLDARQSDPDGIQASSEDNPTLSVLFDRWRSERTPPPKTWQEWTTARKRFEQVLGGDVPVRLITKAHVRAYKESLLRTPKRHGNSAVLSPASVTKGLGAIRSVLAWAVDQGYLDVNPADGIRHAGARSAEQRSRRLPYDADDLNRIFGQKRPAGADTWLPLLGLWTGARLEELGGLRVEDMKDEGDVPYIFIRASDGRRLKNRGSERRVPLHPELVRAGFLDYVAERKRVGDTLLFPELRADAHGTRTRMWGKRFARHVRHVCGVTDKRKASFHSLRHSFVDAARAVMIEEHRHAITGHSGGGVGRTYGTSVPLSVLAESMAKVRYDGLG
jgi:integrase